jgi:hypothetical protein
MDGVRHDIAWHGFFETGFVLFYFILMIFISYFILWDLERE